MSQTIPSERQVTDVVIQQPTASQSSNTPLLTEENSTTPPLHSNSSCNFNWFCIIFMLSFFYTKTLLQCLQLMRKRFKSENKATEHSYRNMLSSDNKQLIQLFKNFTLKICLFLLNIFALWVRTDFVNVTIKFLYHFSHSTISSGTIPNIIKISFIIYERTMLVYKRAISDASQAMSMWRLIVNVLDNSSCVYKTIQTLFLCMQYIVYICIVFWFNKKRSLNAILSRQATIYNVFKPQRGYDWSECDSRALAIQKYTSRFHSSFTFLLLNQKKFCCIYYSERL